MRGPPRSNAIALHDARAIFARCAVHTNGWGAHRGAPHCCLVQRKLGDRSERRPQLRGSMLVDGDAPGDSTANRRAHTRNVTAAADDARGRHLRNENAVEG
jgi:hypothetical protein